MKEATGMLMLQSRGISSIPLRRSAILTYLLLPECEICCQGRPPAGRVVCLSDLRVHCSVMRERTNRWHFARAGRRFKVLLLACSDRSFTFTQYLYTVPDGDCRTARSGENGNEQSTEKI
jgi:hypothetical protein